MSDDPLVTGEGLGTARGGLRRGALITYSSTAAILGMNIVTGVVVARALGPEGRGDLTAATTAPLVIAWIAAFGANQAVTFHHSRHPEDAPTLLATWAVLLAPLAVVAIIVGELLLPVLLSAQTDETTQLARLFMLTVALMLAAEPLTGILLGDHDFAFFNVVRAMQPAMLAVAYLILWGVGHLTVAVAVAVTAGASAIMVVVLATRVLRRHGFGRPDARLARETFWYGARAHGDTVGAVANARLDLLIMPAFLAAASVGLYSIATNVTGMIVTICGSLAVVLMPVASRLGDRAAETVVTALHATFILGGVFAVIAALVASPAIRLVYGADFEGSVAPLRILLPGSVLLAAALVLSAGLYALDRPFTAFVAQLGGVVVTIPGLILFLEDGGIVAAAIVSSIAYGCVFLGTLVAYRRAAGIPWAGFVTGFDRLRVPSVRTWRRGRR